MVMNEAVFSVVLRRFFSLRMRAFFPGTRMNWFFSVFVFWVASLVLWRWSSWATFLCVSVRFRCCSFCRMLMPLVSGMALYMSGFVIICSIKPQFCSSVVIR